MTQEFNPARNVYLDKDAQGTVIQLNHTHAPVLISGNTPQIVAGTYLNQFGELLGLASGQLKNLSLSPSTSVEQANVEYRFSLEKHQFDTATVAYYQTDLGLPVWQAGISVQLKLNPFRVLSAQSTRHPDLEVKAPSDKAVKKAEAINEEELARLLGINEKTESNFVPDPKSLKIENHSLVIYRYESAKRVALPASKDNKDRANQIKGFNTDLPTLTLPPANANIQDGHHYVCSKINFLLSGTPFGNLHWVVLVEVETLTVLYLRAFVDCVNGMVFEDDPVTTNGGPLPGSTSALLNPVRVSDVLPGLSAPVAGTQSLTGNNIQMSDAETPTIAMPTEPGGTDFDFDARTDNFAAVNAYYHTDKFFRLLDGMGFTQGSYFGLTTFPTIVDHRGHYGSTDGIEINAHCVGNSGGAGIARTTFMLADLGDTTNPLGIACDYRVVLHELGGHGTLYNHVSSANFGFSHSAGDSIAVVLNDPGSQATDRFQSFPWMYGAVARRHDRTPAGGWGWAGSIGLHPFDTTLDYLGYNNEQILSSTHFRLYQSIGGDSTDLPTKQFAARMTAYLILRAIATLTPSTNPSDASGFATALMAADLGDWTSENITGGAYSKVIRWAFEKQGLYQAAGTATPNNNAGDPPAVDVYFDDGRGGEYPYQPVWWACESIWNRLASDGGTTHQEPITNQTNYAYCVLKNRGSQNATNVVVKAYHANPAAGLSYPIDWFPMTTPQLSASDVPAGNGGVITVGPFEWTPTDVGHECLFMIVSATGDASNADNIATGDSIPEWRLVPNDNNIGQRNVYPIAGSGTSGLTDDFNQLTFQLKNPNRIQSSMEVRTQLPSFLVKRGWKINFTSRGGSAFPLQAGESRSVVMKLVPGADFSAADVNASPDKTIQLWGYAGGILVGGMSYVLDPNLKPFGKGHPGHPKECDHLGKELLKCVDWSELKVRGISVRSINVDIEIKRDCD